MNMTRVYLVVSIIFSICIISFPVTAQSPSGTPATETGETTGVEPGATEAEPGVEPGTDPEEEPQHQRETTWDLIEKGGLTMVGLGLISTIIVAFSFERFFFFRRQQVRSKGFFEEMQGVLAEGDLNDLQKHFENDPRLLARILFTALTHSELGLERVEKAIEAGAAVEIGKLERGLNLLSNMGNLAPLLGFFGTVVGMRVSFLQFVEKAAPTAKDLAGGVEEALITTAAGLLIAIPTYLIYNLFIYSIDSVSIELERCAQIVLEKLK